MLDLKIDPKLTWALSHRAGFPVDVNTAPRERLLRVPGFGTRSVERILRVAPQRPVAARRSGAGRLRAVTGAAIHRRRRLSSGRSARRCTASAKAGPEAGPAFFVRVRPDFVHVRRNHSPRRRRGRVSQRGPTLPRRGHCARRGGFHRSVRAFAAAAVAWRPRNTSRSPCRAATRHCSPTQFAIARPTVLRCSITCCGGSPAASAICSSARPIRRSRGSTTMRTTSGATFTRCTPFCASASASSTANRTTRRGSSRSTSCSNGRCRSSSTAFRTWIG